VSSVIEEWRVTGDPGHGYPPYQFIWSTATSADPETPARAFVEMVRDRHDWVDGPNLHYRTVTYSEWRVPA
jgi:hypothetical protein